MSASKWKPYPEYKNTKSELLRIIPSHWQMKRTRFLCEITTGGSDTQDAKDEGMYPFFVRSPYIERIDSYSFDGEGVLTSGDGAGVGKIFHHYIGKFDFHQRVYLFHNFNDIQGRLFYHFIKENLADAVLALSAKSTVDSIRLPMLQNFQIAFAPKDEQKEISQFLDEKTQLIDKIIRLLEASLVKLEEVRSALITQAVTKGLNPDAPMKDSGIDTIGIIPEHWKISRLKYHSDINGRIGFRGYNVSDLVDRDEGALSLGATHISPSGEIDLEKPVYLSWQKYYESPEIMLSKGDILTVQRGSTCGKIGLIANDLGPATINPSLVVIKNTAIDSKFMFYLLKSEGIQNLFNSILGTTAIPMISQEQIGEIPICIPPPEEVKEISDYLSSQILLANEVESKTKNYINILKEYRIALISAAVTGKIDVRGLA
jgi:type I restriction enzyme, S subunit